MTMVPVLRIPVPAVIARATPLTTRGSGLFTRAREYRSRGEGKHVFKVWRSPGLTLSRFGPCPVAGGDEPGAEGQAQARGARAQAVSLAGLGRAKGAVCRDYLYKV